MTISMVFGILLLKYMCFYRKNMYEMQGLIVNSINAWGHWAYVLLFFGLLLEGETFLFGAFLLVCHGQLSLSLVFFVAILGVLAGDWCWFWIGRHLERFSWLSKKMGVVASPIDRQILKRPFHTLFLSKFIYGIHRITQIRSGVVKIDPKTFWQADILATLFWVGSIAGLGYFSSMSIGWLQHIFKYAELSFLFVVVVFFLLAHLVSWYGKKHLEEDIQEEECGSASNSKTIDRF